MIVIEEIDELERWSRGSVRSTSARPAWSVCVRVPHDDAPGQALQEVRELRTDHPSLLGLADWLRCQRSSWSRWRRPRTTGSRCTTCWRPRGSPAGCSTPSTSRTCPAGRRPTSWTRSGWPRSSSGGMCRPSLVHPKPIRQLRDLTRYRRSLVREHTREKQRAGEDPRGRADQAGLGDQRPVGVSGREMLQAMIAGERDPKVLAQMARGPMRAKIPQLREALTGHFDDHHAFLCATMLRPHRRPHRPRSPRWTPGSKQLSPLSPTRWPSSRDHRHRRPLRRRRSSPRSVST